MSKIVIQNRMILVYLKPTPKGSDGQLILFFSRINRTKMVMRKYIIRVVVDYRFKGINSVIVISHLLVSKTEVIIDIRI